MKKGFKYWLRWIGMLPISIISGLLVTFPIHWILYSTLSGGDSPFITPYPRMPEQILQPFFAALVIVWVASQIAPQYKLKVALIMATLWVFGAGGAFILGYLEFHIDKVQLNLIAGGLPIIWVLLVQLSDFTLYMNNYLKKSYLKGKDEIQSLHFSL